MPNYNKNILSTEKTYVNNLFYYPEGTTFGLQTKTSTGAKHNYDVSGNYIAFFKETGTHKTKHKYHGYLLNDNGYHHYHANLKSIIYRGKKGEKVELPIKSLDELIQSEFYLYPLGNLIFQSNHRIKLDDFVTDFTSRTFDNYGLKNDAPKKMLPFGDQKENSFDILYTVTDFINNLKYIKQNSNDLKTINTPKEYLAFLESNQNKIITFNTRITYYDYHPDLLKQSPENIVKEINNILLQHDVRKINPLKKDNPSFLNFCIPHLQENEISDIYDKVDSNQINEQTIIQLFNKKYTTLAYRVLSQHKSLNLKDKNSLSTLTIQDLTHLKNCQLINYSDLKNINDENLFSNLLTVFYDDENIKKTFNTTQSILNSQILKGNLNNISSFVKKEPAFLTILDSQSSNEIFKELREKVNDKEFKKIHSFIIKKTKIPKNDYRLVLNTFEQHNNPNLFSYLLTNSNLTKEEESTIFKHILRSDKKYKYKYVSLLASLEIKILGHDFEDVIPHIALPKNNDFTNEVIKSLDITDYNRTKNGQKTYLHIACHYGKHDTVNFLLTKNVNVNEKADYTDLFRFDGSSPVDMTESSPLLVYLRAKGFETQPDTFEKIKQNITSFIQLGTDKKDDRIVAMALNEKKIKTALFLVQNGFSVNYTNTNGNNILHLFSKGLAGSGYEDAIKVAPELIQLILPQIEPKLIKQQNNKGLTPIDILREQQSEDAADFKINAIKQSVTYLEEAQFENTFNSEQTKNISKRTKI